jgi:WD40 repeat protein
MTEQNSLNRFQSFDPLQGFNSYSRKTYGKNAYFSASFSPDGQLIATGDNKRSIKLWQPDGTLIKSLTGHIGAVYHTSFSPDGQILASGSADNTIKLWQRDGTLIKTLGTPSDDEYDGGSVTGIRFSPDGQILASGYADNTINLWQQDGTLIKTLGEPPADHQFNPINSLSFSPDGQTFISCDREGTINLWSRDGTLIKPLIENGKYVVSGSSLRGATFSPDGQTIAAGTMYGTINLWQLDGTLIRTLGEPRKVLPESLNFSPYGRARVATLSFSPDGNTVAVGFSKDEGFAQSDLIELWETSGKLVEQVEISGIYTTNDISFSPDGNTIALSTWGGTGIIKLRH